MELSRKNYVLRVNGNIIRSFSNDVYNNCYSLADICVDIAREVFSADNSVSVESISESQAAVFVNEQQVALCDLQIDRTTKVHKILAEVERFRKVLETARDTMEESNFAVTV